ncbi:hypothetical protein [Methylocystis sp.]|uniref:hypothetical protein n=1 Tax=Methylocystis sp. TaxID=1911079 RepID=UPI003D0A2599
MDGDRVTGVDQTTRRATFASRKKILQNPPPALLKFVADLQRMETLGPFPDTKLL